jgi:hypothetical protein
LPVPFESDAVVVARYDDNTWELVNPLRYHGAVDTFYVPPGFLTDFASVPRIGVWLIPRFGRYTRAAILHDWLCKTQPIPPVDVDGVFRRVMREEGVQPVKRYLMWAGVRWGALTDPRRRRGWWRTAPQLIGITILALPLGIPMAAVGLGLGMYGIAELIATGGRHAGTVKT